MNVEPLLVYSGDEYDGYSKVSPSGWVQTKARQVVQVTIADERVVANRRSGITSWIRHVLDTDSDNFVTIVADGIRVGFTVACDKHSSKNAFRAWQIAVRNVHSTKRV